MADSGPDRPVRNNPGAERPANGDLAELRKLLLGPEVAELAGLGERIRDRSLRATDLSEVLPDAILLRAKRDPHLRQALQPILEEALSISVRKDPTVLAEALFPVIGDAVRRAVRSALQGMIESLNQIVETSITFRSIGWRIEAARTGKSYGEIALLRSLLYRVEQVFLIQNGSGLLLQHVIRDPAVVRDPDLVSGMLTAIQNFVQDSFGAAGDSLETVRVGDFCVWIQQGPQALLAAVIQGTPPFQIRGVLSSALETIHQDYAVQLASFQGDATSLDGARPVLKSCLLGQSPPGRHTSRLPLYVIGGVLAVALAIWVGISIREGHRWQRYLAALGEEPGIVVTHQERHGTRFSISGLRDPLARDPVEALHSVGIPAAKVSSNWHAYQSLSPRFVAMRELPGLTSRLEQQMIHFDSGKSALTPSAMDSVRVVAGLATALFKAAEATGQRVQTEIAGHTDQAGTSQSNEQLGLDRALAVQSALIALGVDARAITVRSAGLAEPLLTGEAGGRHAANRRVSFRVLRLPDRDQP
jgi:outer membrane protein OmpA-like peptidoglycan-associated protein